MTRDQSTAAAPDLAPAATARGGMYVASGSSVTLQLSSVSSNSAIGGNGGNYKGAHAHDGLGEGGGLYLAAGAVVDIDAYTLAHFSHNHASTAGPDIAGPYTPIT